MYITLFAVTCQRLIQSGLLCTHPHSSTMGLSLCFNFLTLDTVPHSEIRCPVYLFIFVFEIFVSLLQNDTMESFV